MRSFVFILAALSIVACERRQPTSSELLGGSMVDNGGDTITCRHDDAMQHSGDPYYEGTYTLDYFLTMDPRVGPADDIEGSQVEDFSGQIADFLRDKLPALAQSFDDYMRLLENSDETQTRVWKAIAMPLTDLDDEDVIQTLPRNCVVDRGGGVAHADLRQMVRRRYMSDTEVQKIFYYYDFQHWNDLRSQLPLQFSYLATHEWLWDYVDSPWVNRTINRLLHSRSAYQMTSQQFQDYLLALDVQIDGGGTIGGTGGEEDPVRSMFRTESLCNYDRRLSADFLSVSPKVVVRPGETKVLDVQFPMDSDHVGPDICGMALMLNHRTVGAGSATLEMQLSRGIPQLPQPVSLSVSPTETQSALRGVCKDRICAERTGELESLVFIRNFLGSKWKLTLKNRSGTWPVEIRQPYLLFVDMKPAS